MLKINQTARVAQRGFTLIELIVVITILGILAAVALPKFTSLQVDARKAKMNGILGSVRAAASITKATALVKSVSCSAATATVTMEAATIDLVYCYPDGSATGIVSAANLSAVNDNLTISSAAGVTTISEPGAATPANCSVTYSASAAADTPPTIALDVTAC